MFEGVILNFNLFFLSDPLSDGLMRKRFPFQFSLFYPTADEKYCVALSVYYINTLENMKGLFYLLIILFAVGICSCTDRNTALQGQHRQEAIRLMDDGIRYEKREEIKQALVCYWDALDILEGEKDTVLKADVYNRLGDLLCKYGLYEKAVENHREGYSLARFLDNKRLLFETTRRLSLDYALLNQPDTAHYFLDLCNQMAAECRLPAFNPLVREQLDHLTLQAKADSVSTIYEREQLLNWENKYKKQKMLLMQAKARNEALLRMIGFLSVICLLLILLIIMYGLKKKEQKRRKEQWKWFNRILSDNKEQLAGYQEELFNSSRRVHELQETIERNHASLQRNSRLHEELQFYIAQEAEFREKENALLLREKQLLSDSSLKAVTLLNQMKNTPSYNPVRTPDEWQALVGFMDLLYDGYSRQIDTVKGLTDRDRELCYLTRLGFTTGQLAIFYGISPGSVTKAKFRIQKKLESEENGQFVHIQIA